QQALAGSGDTAVRVTCPAGELALSGGWDFRSNDAALASVIQSWLIGTSTWEVWFHHAGGLTVEANVECLKNAPGATIGQHALSVSVPANSLGGAGLSCPAGQGGGGGGFHAFGGQLEVTDFLLFGPPGAVYANNHSASAARLDVFAECLQYPGAHSSLTAPIAVLITSGAIDSLISHICPSGTFVSGG